MSQKQEIGIVKIKCCDCGVELKAAAPIQPKAIAKSAQWEHAGTGLWRCADCVKDWKLNRKENTK
jgi:hypothetical protein